MLNNKNKYNFFCNIENINNNINIYLVLDNKNFNYIYINNNIIYNKYIYILNNMYIFFINNNIYYLIFKIYKYIFNKNINKIQDIKYKLILTIIGINYKFYYIKKNRYLIFQLKYSHKIIIKLPNIINCEINKNLICLYSINLLLLNSIGKLINSFQYINKYKELGLKIL